MRPCVRRRLEPLAVRPFGRLLGSYTVNDLGDSIGVVALAVLVFDRTDAVAPTAAFFLVAKFLPALIAPVLTAHLDRLRAAPHAAGALRARGARRSPRWPVLADRRPLRARSRCSCSGSSTARWRSPAAGSRAAPSRRVLQPRAPARRGQRADEPRLRGLVGLRRRAGGLLIAEFGVSAALLVDAALVPGDRGRARRVTPTCPARHARAAAAGSSASATASRYRARRTRACALLLGRPVARADLLHAGRPDRGHLREGEPRTRRAPASACCWPPGAPASCSAACSSSRSRTAPGSG